MQRYVMASMIVLKAKMRQIAYRSKHLVESKSLIPSPAKKLFTCFRTTAGEVITRTAGVWHSGCFPRSMERNKLSLICALLNMKGERAKQLRTDKPELAGRAVFDRFNVVPISRINKQVVFLRMRSGHNPYITFKNSTDNNCYKLFVDCQ